MDADRRPAAALTSPDAAPARACGDCSLCCTLLRVDELGKLGGTPCRFLQVSGSGCSIHAQRPGICRAYRCLWLRGGLREQDRPDRLGALVDLVPGGLGLRLSISEATPGAFDRSSRLQEIAEEWRATLPVRIVPAGDALDPQRAFRVLLPGGEEQRVQGERIQLRRDGRIVADRRMHWLARRLRALALAWRRRRLRGLR